MSRQVKSSQVSNPHKSKSSQSSSSKNFTCACGVLWCCSSGFSASGWADIRIIPLSFSVFFFGFFVFFVIFLVILSKKTCASRRVIGVSFHLSLPLDSFQLGLLFRPEMLSPVPSLHRVEFCCGFLFGVTSLLVRGEGDPSGSWVAWRWRFG